MILALLLGGAAIAIWLLTKGGGEQPSTNPSASTSTSTSPTPSSPTKVTPTPALADPKPEPGADEYTVGAVQVRDHRGGNSPHMDVPPNMHPPHAHELASTIVADVAQQVRGVMQQCAASLPREARGSSPRLDGQLVVAVKGEQLTVTGATMQLRDVYGAGLEPTRQCIEQRAIGLHAAAAKEPDVEGYSISVTFALL